MAFAGADCGEKHLNGQDRGEKHLNGQIEAESI